MHIVLSVGSIEHDRNIIFIFLLGNTGTDSNITVYLSVHFETQLQYLPFYVSFYCIAMDIAFQIKCLQISILFLFLIFSLFLLKLSPLIILILLSILLRRLPPLMLAELSVHSIIFIVVPRLLKALHLLLLHSLGSSLALLYSYFLISAFLLTHFSNSINN